MKKRILAISVVALVAILGASLWFFVHPAGAPAPKTSSQQQAAQVSQEKPITVSLPGADPIDARVEDYDDPASIWVVVSKDYPLAQQDYAPTDLTLMKDKSRTDKGNDERSIRAVTVTDFNDLLSAAGAAGYDLMIGSGYRPYSLQAFYYNHYVAVSGEAAANKYSAKPGQSEHQTGLAADITLRSMQCYIDTCFGDTAAGKWVAANAWTYGFIIRYPADKTEITKYQYEPWHIRYVGKPLAKALHQSRLTLDEARPYLQQARSELIAAKKITVQ